MRTFVQATILMSLSLVVSAAVAAPKARASKAKLSAPKAERGLATSAGQSQTKTVYSSGQSLPYKINPVAGMTLNRLVGGEGDYSIDSGFKVGALVDLGSGTTVFVTGLTVSQLNSQLSGKDGRPDVQIIQNYVSAPVQGKTSFDTGGPARPYIRYGGDFNVVASANAKYNGKNDDIKGDMNTVNLSGVLGVGVTIPAKSVNVNVDFAFNRSLTKINTSGKDDLFNQSFVLTAGVLL